MTDSLSPAAVLALKACLSSRGPSKGMLLKTPPSPFACPEANAAWNAAMLVVNPYKVSTVTLMFISRRAALREIANEVTAFFADHPQLRHLDRDRSALERLGVW